MKPYPDASSRVGVGPRRVGVQQKAYGGVGVCGSAGVWRLTRAYACAEGAQTHLNTPDSGTSTHLTQAHERRLFGFRV